MEQNRFSFINWQRVRGFGELQVLTRASYIILFFVPVLAGLWPGVKLVVNQYNKAVTDSRVALEFASEKLKHEAIIIDQAVNDNKLPQKDLIREKALVVIQELDHKINRIISDYSLKTIEKAALPLVWVEAFFASLFVLIAHLIYQSMAPDIVRQTSMQQYGIDRRNLQAENPSQGLVDRAQLYLQMSKGRFGRDIREPSFPEEKRQWELDIVEQGAYAEYFVHSRSKLVSAWASGLFYILAILLICNIALHQSISVLRSAEFIK